MAVDQAKKIVKLKDRNEIAEKRNDTISFPMKGEGIELRRLRRSNAVLSSVVEVGLKQLRKDRFPFPFQREEGRT